MRIVVFGATGATGTNVVERALALGYEVVAVARQPERIKRREHLTPRKGDVLDSSSLDDACRGADALISCIGPAKNLSPGTVMSEGVVNMIAACRRVNVRRFVLQSGITLSDGGELTVLNRYVLRALRPIFAKAINDKAIAEHALVGSDLDWVIVRPVGLRNAPATSKYTAGPNARIAPLRPLPFADCADCLVRAATEPSWVRQIINVGR